MASKSFNEKWEANCLQMATNIRFISGKWFVDGVENKQIDRYIMNVDANINTLDKLKKTKDMFIMLHGEDGDWLELPIIEEARQQKTLKPLCFPLNKQQLTIINRLLLGQNEEVAFICTGVGGSGKSTFLNIVRQIFDNDCAACTLSELNGFNISEAVSHRLIASDELASDELNNGLLKSIISRQHIQVNPKGQTPYQTKCQSALFFCCNEAPKIDLDDTGMLRRIIYYKMNEKIKNPDRTLNHREWSHEDLVNIVAHALAVDTRDWKIQFEADTHFYLLKNNSVYRYKEAKSYDEYEQLCKSARLKPFSEPKYQSIRALINEWEGSICDDIISRINAFCHYLGEIANEENNDILVPIAAKLGEYADELQKKEGKIHQ